ncbi:MAG: protein adenylyltransferase SelO family protein, partial [Pigmentiphaga sp.]|nr:protein adenylyltransferase SelO family protein [Pigmentiphaga sp.]
MSSDVLTLPPVQNRFASLPSDFYRRVQPQGLTQARLVHVNAALAARCGLDPDVLSSQAFLDMAAGNAGLPDGITLAAVYSGHQFGVWAGQLGDGRALLLGETVG